MINKIMPLNSNYAEPASLNQNSAKSKDIYKNDVQDLTQLKDLFKNTKPAPVLPGFPGHPGYNETPYFENNAKKLENQEKMRELVIAIKQAF